MLATANHYLLDIVVAPGVVALAYAIAALAECVANWTRRRAPSWRARTSVICWTRALRAQAAVPLQGRARCPAIPRISPEVRLRQLARQATEARNRRPAPCGGHQQGHRLGAGGRLASALNMTLWVLYSLG